MKITAAKVKRELIYMGWLDLKENDDINRYTTAIISDTLKIVDKILKEQKNISIK